MLLNRLRPNRKKFGQLLPRKLIWRRIKGGTGMKSFYLEPLPKCDISRLSGKLIVLEGSDGSTVRLRSLALNPGWKAKAMRSWTASWLARNWLVRGTELARAAIPSAPQPFLYFMLPILWIRLENVIIPALRAGFIVLADRYFYTLMARDLVRGLTLKMR